MNIKDYIIKIISIGVKIMVFDNETYHHIMNKLKSENIEHFTFRSTTDRPLKVCINGLPSDFTEDEIKSGLQLQGINSSDIFSVHPIYFKTPYKTTTFKYFLVKFNNTNVKMQMLHKIKHIHQTAIRFTHYTTTRNITQCRRCQMFGHGSSHCNKIFKCSKCSANHPTTECKSDPANYNVQTVERHILQLLKTVRNLRNTK